MAYTSNAGSNGVVVENLLQNMVLDPANRRLVFMADTKYTGQLRRQGDTVSVITSPNVQGRFGGTAGADITSENVYALEEDFKINELFTINIPTADLERIRANYPLMSEYAKAIAFRTKDVRDKKIAQTAVLNASTSLNEGSPATLTSALVIPELEELRTALENNNIDVLESNISCYVNPAIGSLIRQASELDSTDLGLAQREAGYVGRMSGMKIKQTNNLPRKQKITIGSVATADNTITFSGYVIRDASSLNQIAKTAKTVTFTAKAVPSAAGEFDVAASAAAQAVIIQAMINGTGTAGATNYIELADEDRQAMRFWGMHCTTFDTSEVAYIHFNQNVTVAETGTFATLGTLAIVLIAMTDTAVNYVEQEEGIIDIRQAQAGKRDNILCEMAYDADVFGQHALEIATSEISNGATVDQRN